VRAALLPLAILAWPASSQHRPPLPVPAVAEPDFARRVLAEVNRARMRPGEVATALRRYRAGFRGRFSDDGDGPRDTFEGPTAVEEAISFLDRQSPLTALAPSELLARAARAHAEEQARTGAVGHGSADGRGPGQRVRGAGGDVYVAEVIAYGFDTPERAVRQLIVDDGVARRGHRAVMYLSRLRYAGVGCARHPHYATTCVIDLAETPDGSPPLPASDR